MGGGVRVCRQETENKVPSGESDVGRAPCVFENGPGACVESVASTTWADDHEGSEMVPACALPIAAAFMNVTVPKFASGTTLQLPPTPQAEGRSLALQMLWPLRTHLAVPVAKDCYRLSRCTRGMIRCAARSGNRSD